MPLRSGLLLAGLLAVAACTDATPPNASADVALDDRAARAVAAGLTDRDVAYIDSAGVTVYVPVLPAGWSLDNLFVEGEAPSVMDPYYMLTYKSPAGACLMVVVADTSIVGTLGDDFSPDPPDERTVAIPGIATDGSARMGWATTAAAGWEAGHVATEWFGSGATQINASTATDERCTNASPDEVEAVLKTLRPLDPANDR